MVTLLLLVSVLALLVATVANDSLQTMKTASQSGRDSQAKYAAYAGMETVMNELRKQEQYHGEESFDQHHGRKEGALGELSKVSYDVLIWNNMQERSSGGGGSGSDPAAIDGPEGVQVQPDTVYMVSTGRDQVKGQEVVLSSVAGTARRVKPVFEDAAFGRSKIMVGGMTLVDAWDSQGGWVNYVEGEFPDPNSPGSGSTPVAGGGSGSGGGRGGGTEMPTVSNYEATLGTDSKLGRTMRMVGQSKLNGYFRIGPGVTGQAFSDDSGTTTPSSSGGSRPGFPGGSGGDSGSTTTYGVATATNPDMQIAGQEGVPRGDKFAKVDDKNTEMPRFVAPYDADDLSPPPTVNNPSGERDERQPDGSMAKVYVPPAPVQLDPGGYESITVPGDQTLELSPGVYYFKKGMTVSGKIKLSGGDPVIVFVGEKAAFNGAEINKDGRTSSLQLCFTDELKEETEVDDLVDKVKHLFDAPTSSSSSESGAPTSGGITAYVRSILTPSSDPEDSDAQEGASLLELRGGSFRGSISGKNLVTLADGAEIFGGVMANVISMEGGAIHQDLALKGSNLMNAGGWSLEGVHQIR